MRGSQIERTALLGFKIQKEHPWIADEYRKGLSVRKIAEKIISLGENTYSRITYARAVSYSLNGYNGSENVIPYKGILSEEERKKLAEDHRKRENLSYESRKKVSRAGIVSKGSVPWLTKEELKREKGELEILIDLVESGNFSHEEERIKGTPKWRLIAEELYKKCGVKRSQKAVRMAYYKSKSV